MKVKELIEVLQKLDPELPVVLAGDEEGNDFHFLSSDVDVYEMRKEGYELYRFDLEDYQSEEHQFNPEAYQAAYDVPPPDDMIRAVVLWP